MKIFNFLTLLLLIPSLCFGAASRSFDGTDDEIDMGNVLDVTTGSVSVCAWVKPTEDAETDTWLGKKTGIALDPSAQPGYVLRQGSGDKGVFGADDGTTTRNATGTIDPDGVWTHYCGVWNGSTDVAEIFANGVSEATNSTGAIGSLTNTVVLQSGGTANNANDSLGLQSHSHVFLSVLTVQQINDAMWFPERSGAIPDGYWPFWGDSPEIDLSLNANTGTVTGATTSTDGPPVAYGGPPMVSQ